MKRRTFDKEEVETHNGICSGGRWSAALGLRGSEDIPGDCVRGENKRARKFVVGVGEHCMFMYYWEWKL